MRSLTFIEIHPVFVIWSRQQSILQPMRLYQIEVDHVPQVVFDKEMVNALLD